MQVLIVYYSFTGNTKKVAETFGDFLKNKGCCVTLLKIRPEKEVEKFLPQVIQTLVRKGCELPQDMECDFNNYEVILVGSPVWALSPVPAVRSYILESKNVKGKKVYLFVTYGSGLGKMKALNIMASLLEKKGAQILGRLAISQKKVYDRDYLYHAFSRKISL